jgi:hypothetical protein
MSVPAERLVKALQAADAAGDVEGARTLAKALRQMQAQGDQPAFDRDAFMAAEKEKYSPTAGMSTGDKLMAGAGKAFSDLGTGAKQMSTRLGNAVGLGRIAPDSFGDQVVQQQEADTAETRQLDQPLMDTKAGFTGNVAGNIAAAAPAMMIPGANGVAGAALAGGVTGALQPSTSAGEAAINTAAGTGLGALGQWGGGKVANWAGNRLANRASNAATQQSQNTVRDATIREGIDAGYAVPPSTTNPTAMNSVLESVAGKAATQQAASRNNQAITNRLVREDLGMAQDVPLTRDTLRQVRDDAGRVYNAVKQTGNVRADRQYFAELQQMVDDNQAIALNFPNAKSKVADETYETAVSLAESQFSADAAVEMVKRLRADAKANFKAAAFSPEKRAIAQAQWEGAGTLEDLIERHLQIQGVGDLATAFRAARTTIAKSHSAELALNEGTGNIQASKLMQQLRKGQPMTGGFSTIARFASAAPKATAEPTESGGVSALSAMMGMGAAGLGQAQLLAIPAARYGTRRALMTPAVQRRAALSSYRPGRTGNSALRGMQGLGQVAAPLSVASYAAEK